MRTSRKGTGANEGSRTTSVALCITTPSFRGDAQASNPESRDSGFASRPGMTGQIVFRAKMPGSTIPGILALRSFERYFTDTNGTAEPGTIVVGSTPFQ